MMPPIEILSSSVSLAADALLLGAEGFGAEQSHSSREKSKNCSSLACRCISTMSVQASETLKPELSRLRDRRCRTTS